MKVMREAVPDINNKNSKLEIPAKSVPGWEGIEIADYRIKVGSDEVSAAIPELRNIRWTSIVESDDGFSGYTTASISGAEGERIFKVLENAVISNKINKQSISDRPTNKIVFYELPGFDDVQLYSIVTSNGNDETNYKVTMVVRPLRIPAEVTILV